MYLYWCGCNSIGSKLCVVRTDFFESKSKQEAGFGSMIPANAKPMFLINLLKLNPLNNKHLLNLIKFNGLLIENEQGLEKYYKIQLFATTICNYLL